MRSLRKKCSTADPGEIEPTPVLMTPTMTEMSTVPVTVVTQTVDIISTSLPELPPGGKCIKK